ncbi:MAG TPA: hypothetical protein G4O03_04240 [Dehalococcoidia bacterium]|nr:hypothetical protein [Dehalococcoidia bacterium]
MGNNESISVGGGSIDFNSLSPSEQEHLQVDVMTSSWRGENTYVTGSTIELEEEDVYIERPSSLFDIRPVDVNELEDVSERHDDYLYRKL